MRIIQVLVATIALLCASVEVRYLFGIGGSTTNAQPVTVLLLVSIFWVCWIYTRLTNFVPSLIKLSDNAVRVVAALLAVAISLIAVYVSSSSAKSQADMMKFGLINVALALLYGFVAITAILGDKWLGWFGRLLKFGREFPATKGGRGN